LKVCRQDDQVLICFPNDRSRLGIEQAGFTPVGNVETSSTHKMYPTHITFFTSRSLAPLRQEPSATQTAIRFANDLSLDEVARSPIALNTLVLLREAIEHDGLALTTTGNLTRVAVAKMCRLIAAACALLARS
jgi:hypothetical protein